MLNEENQLSRFDARIPTSVYNTIRRACEIQGRSMSDFVIDAAREKAEEAIATHDVIRLSLEDQTRFAEMLRNPPPLNAAMNRAAEDHQRLIEQQP
jgi:uncharacterized protein (DUF1778 family)